MSWWRAGRGNERGSVTVFGLGLVVLILSVGAMSIDMWRVITVRQDLLHRADAAASAGANAIDIVQYRLTGQLVLDAVHAPMVANRMIGSVGDPVVASTSEVQVRDGDGIPNDLVVSLSAEVDFALLGALTGQGSIVVTVESVASPERTSG
jgi:Flp pilus assembly protein TadG